MTYDQWYKKIVDKLVNDCGLEKNVAEKIISGHSVYEINTIIKFLRNYGNMLKVT